MRGHNDERADLYQALQPLDLALDDDVIGELPQVAQQRGRLLCVEDEAQAHRQYLAREAIDARREPAGDVGGVEARQIVHEAFFFVVTRAAHRACQVVKVAVRAQIELGGALL